MENSRVGSSSELSNKNHANPRCHHSPTPPANAAGHTGRTSDFGDSFDDKINENNQETMNHHFTKPMGSDYHASTKVSKHFRGATVSAASTPKKKILGENGESLNYSKSNAEDEGSISTTMYSSLIMTAEEDLHESTKAGPHQSNPASSFSVEDTPDSCGIHCLKDFERITSSVPYDPVNNYLLPRPQYLRYRPNRRIEWALSNRKHPDDEEHSVSDEYNMDQIEKDRNFSEDENLCIPSSGDESSDNHESCSEYNQEHINTSPTKDARESPQYEDDDDNHCGQVKGLSFRLLCLAIVFVLILAGFSLSFTDWPAASSSITFPDKIIFQAKYVSRILKATPDSLQFKCLKLIESRSGENQKEDLQVLAEYLCAVLYPHGVGYGAHSSQSYPAHTVETMDSIENSSHNSSLEDETPLSMYHESILKHVGVPESDDSSRMTIEREPMEQVPSLLLGSVENADEVNEMQELRFNNDTGEVEHDLPKSSEPLEVPKDDYDETGEMEYGQPTLSEEFEFTEDVGDSELTGEPDTIIVVDPEMDQIINGEEEYENKNEEQLGTDTDEQLNNDDDEISEKRSWLLQNKAKGGFVAGFFALAAVISTIFCVSYRRKHSRVGGAEDVGTPLLSCEKEATRMESARSPEGIINGVIPPRAVGGEKQEAQTGHLATSSVCCNEVAGASVTASSSKGNHDVTSSLYSSKVAGASVTASSSKGNHDVTSSLYSSKVAEAEVEVSSGRRYRKKNVTAYTNHEAVSPPSENSTAASFSYGSFYSQEKLKGSGDEEMATPVRRSSRLRKQVLPVKISRH